MAKLTIHFICRPLKAFFIQLFTISSYPFNVLRHLFITLFNPFYGLLNPFLDFALPFKAFGYPFKRCTRSNYSFTNCLKTVYFYSFNGKALVYKILCMVTCVYTHCSKFSSTSIHNYYPSPAGLISSILGWSFESCHQKCQGTNTSNSKLSKFGREC